MSNFYIIFLLHTYTQTHTHINKYSAASLVASNNTSIYYGFTIQKKIMLDKIKVSRVYTLLNVFYLKYLYKTFFDINF